MHKASYITTTLKQPLPWPVQINITYQSKENLTMLSISVGCLYMHYNQLKYFTLFLANCIWYSYGPVTPNSITDVSQHWHRLTPPSGVGALLTLPWNVNSRVSRRGSLECHNHEKCEQTHTLGRWGTLHVNCSPVCTNRLQYSPSNILMALLCLCCCGYVCDYLGIMRSLIHILQGCFSGSGKIVWLYMMALWEHMQGFYFVV